MPSRQLQILLACGLTCGMMGCKSPMTWFSPSAAGSTAPVVQYNGIQGSSATIGTAGSTPKEGMMSGTWSSITSLLGTSQKLDGDIYIRAAHFAEQAGKYKEAEAKYQQALKVEPKNVDAMLGLARLYDHQGNSQQAVATYQKAIKTHPKDAKVYNDFGLCYSHRREFGPAQQMLQKAVELEPGKTNYRINLATVMIDMGRPSEALQNLVAVQPEGVARYNMACLLEERGQHDQAADQLRLAIAKDSSLGEARELLAQLEGGQPQQSQQQPLQMVNATFPRGQQQRPNMQIDPRDLQPPDINNGPQSVPQGYQQQEYQEDLAPQAEQPIRRSSYEDEAKDEKKAEKKEAAPPATIHISDDE